jgi:hypothetical protein
MEGRRTLKILGALTLLAGLANNLDGAAGKLADNLVGDAF